MASNLAQSPFLTQWHDDLTFSHQFVVSISVMLVTVPERQRFLRSMISKFLI